MTRYEAMNTLEDYRDYILPEDIEAFNMAINALENERPKGRWLARNGNPTETLYGVYCSECKDWSEYASNYCMNCGADMRGEDE